MIPLRKSCLTLGIALAALTAALAGAAHAQSSLGIGASEAMLPSTGLFAHWLYWINAQQQAFYRLLTGALKAMRTDGDKLWVLVGLSFVYGIFHAAGPGHGKAVISSYMLATEVALRRGHLDDRRDLGAGDRQLCGDRGLRRMAAVEEGEPAAAFPFRPRSTSQPFGRPYRPRAWPFPRSFAYPWSFAYPRTRP